MKIILTGFMGAGKTTVSHFLAKKLNFSQIELDNEIIKNSNESSVPEIFTKHGEAEFRKLELENCSQLEQVSKAVISTGGGIGIDEEKIKILTQNTGIIFFLQTEFETVKKRIGTDQNRPLFADEKKARNLFLNRQTQYKKLADFKISTDNKAPEEVADEIFSILKRMKLCLVIGNPIKHSLSPKFHNEAFEFMGLSDFVFKTEQVKNKDLPTFFENLPKNIPGISVTIPHKTEILKFCDQPSLAVQKIGAANTIFFKNNKIWAENTDAQGIINPILKRISSLKNKRVAVLGAGGVARAAVCAVSELNAKVGIFARNPKLAELLAKKFNSSFGSLSEITEITKYEIIINATPCGMTGPLENTSAVPSSVFNKNQIVFDLVYTPIETQFLRDAKKTGAIIIPGIEMFIYQAAEQFEIYTGKKLSLDFCEDFIQKSIKE